jgi:hypothetical protein
MTWRLDVQQTFRARSASAEALRRDTPVLGKHIIELTGRQLNGAFRAINVCVCQALLRGRLTLFLVPNSQIFLFFITVLNA